MKHIKTINKANLADSAKKGGCGKCQASCQSACKTSCTVGNQKCKREDKDIQHLKKRGFCAKNGRTNYLLVLFSYNRKFIFILQLYCKFYFLHKFL